MTNIKKNQWPIIFSVIFILIAGILVYRSAKPEVVAPDESYQQQLEGTPSTNIEDGITADEPHIHVVQAIAYEGLITPGYLQPRSFYPKTTALEALERDFKVEKSGSGENAFITSINGVEASDKDKTFWAFYVNGKQAEVGAGSYELQDNDVIEWKLEKY